MNIPSFTIALRLLDESSEILAELDNQEVIKAKYNVDWVAKYLRERRHLWIETHPFFNGEFGVYNFPPRRKDKTMRTIKEVLDIVEQTLEHKGNTYGPTYRKVATMLSVQPQYSILVRMLEKIARCHNLLKQNGGLAHLREEFIDIACYAVLAAFESEPQDAQNS